MGGGHDSLVVLRLTEEVLEGDAAVRPVEDVGAQVGPGRDAGQVAGLGHQPLLHLDPLGEREKLNSLGK